EQLLVGEAGPAARACARRDFRPANRGHSSEGRWLRGKLSSELTQALARCLRCAAPVLHEESLAVDPKKVAFWRSRAQPPTSSSACARRRSAVLSINCFLIRLLRQEAGIVPAVSCVPASAPHVAAMTSLFPAGWAPDGSGCAAAPRAVRARSRIAALGSPRSAASSATASAIAVSSLQPPRVPVAPSCAR